MNASAAVQERRGASVIKHAAYLYSDKRAIIPVKVVRTRKFGFEFDFAASVMRFGQRFC